MLLDSKVSVSESTLSQEKNVVASIGLLGPARAEISHRFVPCSEGEHDLSIDQIFPDQDLSRKGLSVTYMIGKEGIEQL